MNGVHDMGGMHGFGAIPRGEGREPFHAEWEGRMFGMLLALGSHGVHDPGRSAGRTRKHGAGQLPGVWLF